MERHDELGKSFPFGMTSFQARILVLGGVGGICFLRFCRRRRLKDTDVLFVELQRKEKEIYGNISPEREATTISKN